MKKILTTFLTASMLFSSLSVHGFDVVSRIKKGDAVNLPASVEYEGAVKSVTWNRSKFESASSGVICVSGKTSDNEAVNLYIIVEDNNAVITDVASDINFNDKKGKFSAKISGSENEYATIFIFNKNDASGDLKSTFLAAEPVHSQTVKISDGAAEFEVELSGFAGGKYIAYVSSGYSQDSAEFEYINFDEFLTEVKKISPSDSARGQKIVDLCVLYSLLMTYDLYPVYSQMSAGEKIEVMEKIPQRLADYGQNANLNTLLKFMNEEVAVKKLQAFTYAPDFLEDKVNLYAKALELDVADKSFYSEINNKDAFSKYFLSKDLSTKALIQSAFYRGVGLCLINESTRVNVKERLGSLDKINGVESLGITDELEKIEKLSITKQNDIYAEIALKTDFKEPNEVKSELQRLLNSSNGNGNGNGNSGGGTGGGGGGAGGGGGSSSGGNKVTGTKGDNLGTFGGNAAIAAATEEKKESEISSNHGLYDDLTEAEWAKVYITRLSELGVISGFDNKIRPNDPVTREEFAKLIVNALGLTESADDMEFCDVNPAEWYAEYVSKLYKSGITKGISETEFGTGTYINREDMAVLTYRAMKLKDSALKSDSEKEIFADDNSISDYAKEAVYELRALSIINGVEDNSYMPKGICSRAMAFKVIAETFYK